MFKSAKFITSAHDTICAIRDDDCEIFIPAAPGNRDYRLLTHGDSDLHIEPLEIEPYSAPGEGDD